MRTPAPRARRTWKVTRKRTVPRYYIASRTSPTLPTWRDWDLGHGHCGAGQDILTIPAPSIRGPTINLGTINSSWRRKSGGSQLIQRPGRRIMGPRRQGDRQGEGQWARVEKAARGRQQVMLDRGRESEGKLSANRVRWPGGMLDEGNACERRGLPWLCRLAQLDVHTGPWDAWPEPGGRFNSMPPSIGKDSGVANSTLSMRSASSGGR
ncbi:hypothetical protein MKZ38_003586 [Zalerion maritima]|uniref:Uncharacterized protein n=1 Tax=Zalerion maritima TaxID=339359 RepID=A0AAD5RNS0_9PEZI|nr:hypothetical protein MKZ38_003586 [Zalerion maritima]